jgi:hypothetical protein
MVMGTPSGTLQYILNSKGNQRMYKDFKLFDTLNGYGRAQMAKIDVKMSNFLLFLLHLSMWCHFNGM